MKSAKLFILCINQTKITKKVYNAIQLQYDYNKIIKICTIFINSENSKTSERHVLILNLTDKLDLRIGKEMLLYQNLALLHLEKYKKLTTNLKHQLQHGMINLNYQMGHILYQIFKITLSIFF